MSEEKKGENIGPEGQQADEERQIGDAEGKAPGVSEKVLWGIILCMCACFCF